MEPRYRNQETSRPAIGYAKRVSLGKTVLLIQQNSSSVTSTSSVIDYLGRDTDHNFFLEKSTKSYGNISGRSSLSNTAYSEYKNYDIYFDQSVPAHLNLGFASENSSMTAAMARSNPSRPVVSVPTFLGELKDFPGLIRQAGNLALRIKGKSKNLRRRGRLKEAADAYLAYKFAINPLISDVQKLMDVQSHTQNRMDELDRLYSNGGMRRRITIASGGQPSRTNVVLDSALSAVIRADVDIFTSGQRWCTLRWLPIGRPSYSNDKEKQDLARSLVLGLNAQSLTSTAWNLLPWSWMVDWFSNVGDFIDANNNAVRTVCVGRCTMTHLETSAHYRRSDSVSWVTGGDAIFTRTSKTRVIGGGSALEASIPLLNGNQLSILGALGVSRGRR